MQQIKKRTTFTLHKFKEQNQKIGIKTLNLKNCPTPTGSDLAFLRLCALIFQHKIVYFIRKSIQDHL